MPTFVMPQLGESDVEGTVLKWLKQPGEHVRAEEPLVEVETEKVNVEIPSPFEGTLAQVMVKEGETVPVGAPLAVIGEADGAEAAPAAPPAPVPVAAESRPTPPDLAAERAHFDRDARQEAGVSRPAVAAEPTGEMLTRTAPHVSTDGRNGSAAPPIPGRGAERYTPAVLRLAQEHDIDLKAIAGTGMEGRVTRKDVMRYIEQGGAAVVAQPPAATSPAPEQPQVTPAQPAPAPVAPASPVQPPAPTPAPAVAPPRVGEAVPAPPAPPSEDEEVVRPSATRLTIARNMVRAAAIPTAWMTVEMDVTKLVRLRESHKEEFRRREGVDLSYLPFIIKATVEALKEHPMLNSQWRDDQIVLKKRINMGVAVGSDEGLIVPVIHNADRLSIAGLAHAVVDLAQRARARKLRLEDVQGGTFTLDNTGVFGSLVSQPIINPPQCAILSTEAIIKRPVVVEDAIAIRSLMNMCISFDHRIVDGSHVGPFMQAVKKRLESHGPDTSIY